MFTERDISPERHNGPKAARLNQLLTSDWFEARAEQDTLRDIALDIAGFDSMDEALDDIGTRTSIILVAAGAGTRWDESFEGANRIYGHAEYDITRGKSRAMAYVPNVLPRDIFPDDTIPVIGYNLWASRHIPDAKRYVIAKEEDEAEIEALASRLGISVECRQQQAVRGGMRGHGDAIAQNIDMLLDVDYALMQFCGDASSPMTIHDSLLTLDALSKSGSSTSVLMATTPYPATSMPLAVDNLGYVRRFNQLKLFGRDIVGDDQELSPSGSNVSIYAFNARKLADSIQRVSSLHEESGSYAFLPFHGGVSDEFAIDDIIMGAAEQRKVKQLCVATAEETTVTKTIVGLPWLVQAMASILRQNGLEPNN